LNTTKARHILRNMNIRLCGVALVTLLLAAGAVQAGGLRDYVRGAETLSAADDALLADLSGYYRLHANVRLGQEERLSNGTAWRQLIDVRTGSAVPRITWMANRKSLLKANLLLEAIHGAALVDYDIQDLERRRMELYEWHNGRPPNLGKSSYTVPQMVAVTYATSRLLSYVEVTRNPSVNSKGIDVRGLVLDLERGRIEEVEGCRNSDDRRDFRLGEWLEVCGDAAYESFKALWVSKIREAVTKARERGAALTEEAGDVPETLRRFSERIALYLTPTGLAVVDKTWGGPRTFNEITVNPVILPYRELEPFLKSGPWSNELLKR
jgi:hypothetical protein